MAASGEWPTPPRPRSPGCGSGPILVVVVGPIRRGDIPGLCDRVRKRLSHSDADRVICDVGSLLDSDVVTVDALARLQLTARRLGRSIGLRDASGELQALLALMGLDDVVPLAAGLGLGPRGQTEEREQGRSVEEEVEPDDATA